MGMDYQMRIFYKLRVIIKKLACKHMLLIEFCHTCGRKQPLVWASSDDLWEELTSGPNGILCPECFDKLATSKKVFIYWKAEFRYRF